MNNGIREKIDQLVGKSCWRKEVGRSKSLSLGFGSEVIRKSKLQDKIYGEWEVGTYGCAWRIVKEGLVLCGSQDSIDNINYLNQALNQIEFGRFVSLQQLTELDVRVQFDNGIIVDILGTISDADECFHIFCPDAIYVEFSIAGGWKFGKSDKPWFGE